MPQNKNTFVPRKGQQDLVEYLPNIKKGDCLSVQWPTGYGKSMGFAMAWKHCSLTGIANRLLLVVANDTQRQQIINDFASDCETVSAPCTGGIWSFERSAGDIRAAMLKISEVFVCTVQQLDASNRGGLNTLKDLLGLVDTKWMIGFDEYHHYGEDMSWGNAAKSAMALSAFTMAMSATPYRRGADVIFPEPTIRLTYTSGVSEGCLKPIICHSYEYKVTVIDEDNDATNYTTSELLNIAPDGLDAWEERKNIRYSAQYLQPLIVNPLARLYQKRAQSGKPLQMLVRAMSCNHAKTVCDQVRVFSGDLKVDWIGTGYNGRPDQENRDVIRRFCPPKESGIRPDPLIDVLVQVSMAGEGFDSINVAEIVDLFPVSARAASGRATQDKQFYGRGARVVPGCVGVMLHVNVPSDHPLHHWGSKELHSWMDAVDSASIGEDQLPVVEPPQYDLFQYPELPKQRDIELLFITKDDQHFKTFKDECVKRRGYDPVNDEDEIFELYKYAASGVSRQQTEQNRTAQVRDYIDGLVGRIALVKARQCEEVNGAVIGRFKKEVNKGIKKNFGRARDEMLADEMEKVAQWLKNYLESMKGLGI